MKVRDVVEKVRRLITEQPQIEAMDKDGVVRIVSAGLDRYGREVPDGVPMAIPVGMKPAEPTLRQLVQRMITEQLAVQAAHAGFESFEEADDFDVPDDEVDPSTPYEIEFEGLPIMQMRDINGVLLPPDKIMGELHARYTAHKNRMAEASVGSGASAEKPKDDSAKDQNPSVGGGLPKGSSGDGAPEK